MFNIRTAALFVGSHNQTHIFFQRNPQFLYGPHGVESRHSRTLVVCSATAIQIAVFYHWFKGFCNLPSLSGRNHIQVSQNIQLFWKATVKIHTSHITIIILNFKAIPLCHIQRRIQTLCRPRTIRHIFLCRHFLAVNPAQLTDILDHFLSMFLHVDFNFLLIHLYLSPYIFYLFDKTISQYFVAFILT